MRFSRKNLGIPYAVFLAAFVLAPLLVLFFYAFTNGQGQFTLANLHDFFGDPNTLGTLVYSFAIACATTLVCLLLAYPVAYFLAMSRIRNKTVVLMLFVMPMWINFSLRITALKEILTTIEGNLAMYPFLNAVLGMTYDFLPFTYISRIIDTPSTGALYIPSVSVGTNPVIFTPPESCGIFSPRYIILCPFFPESSVKNTSGLSRKYVPSPICTIISLSIPSDISRTASCAFAIVLNAVASDSPSFSSLPSILT